MRILQINSSRTFGGGERHFIDLCDGLRECGHDVSVAVRADCNWLSRIKRVPPENLYMAAPRNAADLVSAGRLRGIARKREIDIVHAHLARDYPAAALAVRGGVTARLVLTRHVLFPLKNVHKLLLRNVSAVIGVSSAVTGNLRKVFPAEKVFLVSNGLSIGTLRNLDQEARGFRFENNISFDDKLITTIGSLTPLKGHHELITAASQIVARHPESRFLLVGGDKTPDERILRELRKRATTLGLRERVIFLDHLDELSPVFAATDIFVSSSRSESFGLAILEAMAHGKAIVATATEGAKELVSNGEDGIIVPVGDTTGLAEAITALIEDPDLAHNLGQSASKTARDKFGLEKMIKSTVEVYSRVLKD